MTDRDKQHNQALTARTALGSNDCMGKVISELARRGLQPAGKQSDRHGFPVFPVAPDASPVTDADVKAALDDEP